MASESKSAIGRRDLLRVLGASAGAAVTGAAAIPETARADSENSDEKRKTRYQANSADVQNYYRVNRYPG